MPFPSQAGFAAAVLATHVAFATGPVSCDGAGPAGFLGWEREGPPASGFVPAKSSAGILAASSDGGRKPALVCAPGEKTMARTAADGRGERVGVGREGMVLIPAGNYAPLIRSRDEPEQVAVPAFWLDARPVTNAEFLAFVRAHPAWRRSMVSPLFSDTGYLADWAGDLEPGPQAPPGAPVVRVSWFAARAYARALGKRLPATAEWERAAQAGFHSEEGATEPGFKAAVLAWFAHPTPPTLPDAGTGRENHFGARDLFGLVWEWVADFNTSMVTGESRADTGLERDLFCGSGAAGARDPSDYAAFMRAGFRSSLRANYAVPNLGFRCAADATMQPDPGSGGETAGQTSSRSHGLEPMPSR